MKTFWDDIAEIESLSEARLAREYLIPFIKKYISPQEPLVLSVGCGVGADCDALIEAGISCYGIDIGSRTRFWNERKNRNRLVIADALRLPFPSNLFDLTYSFGVIEHIGTIGIDITKLTPDFHEKRQEFAASLTRVTKMGGGIIVSCPNRAFPIDFQHAGSFGIRFHSPNEPYLFSFADIEKLFIQGCGCKSIYPLQLKGFFGFSWASSLPKKVLVPFAKIYLSLLSSEPFLSIRRSFLNPYTLCLIKR